jgi:hypothetical protein
MQMHHLEARKGLRSCSKRHIGARRKPGSLRPSIDKHEEVGGAKDLPVQVETSGKHSLAWAMVAVMDHIPAAHAATVLRTTRRMFEIQSKACFRVRSPPSTMPDGIMSRLFRNVHHHDF